MFTMERVRGIGRNYRNCRPRSLKSTVGPAPAVVAAKLYPDRIEIDPPKLSTGRRLTRRSVFILSSRIIGSRTWKIMRWIRSRVESGEDKVESDGQTC
jgi:hypothetical protein